MMELASVVVFLLSRFVTNTVVALYAIHDITKKRTDSKINGLKSINYRSGMDKKNYYFLRGHLQKIISHLKKK